MYVGRRGKSSISQSEYQENAGKKMEEIDLQGNDISIVQYQPIEATESQFIANFMLFYIVQYGNGIWDEHHTDYFACAWIWQQENAVISQVKSRSVMKGRKNEENSVFYL